MSVRDEKGYIEMRRMRQAEDDAWVADEITDSDRSLADLGCGTGDFLIATLTSRPGIERAFGIDSAASRVATARSRLVGFGARAYVEQADLLDCPEIGKSFDVMTLMSVLHWIYPRERRVFKHLAKSLSAAGRLIMTTYHPAVDDTGLGGTDALVAEALQSLGVPRERTPELFAAAGITPITRRTRSPERIRSQLASAGYSVARTAKRTATVRASSPAEYSAYHAATFGAYYRRAMPLRLANVLLDELGRVAMQRMATQGWVTRMSVLRWTCARTCTIELGSLRGGSGDSVD